MKNYCLPGCTSENVDMKTDISHSKLSICSSFKSLLEPCSGVEVWALSQLWFLCPPDSVSLMVPGSDQGCSMAGGHRALHIPDMHSILLNSFPGPDTQFKYKD